MRKPPVATQLEQAIAATIKSIRILQGLSQDQMAARLRRFTGRNEWTRAVIAALEAGGRHISLDDLLVFAWIFNLPVTDLIPDTPGGISVGGLSMSARQIRRAITEGDFPKVPIRTSNPGEPAPAAALEMAEEFMSFLDANADRLGGLDAAQLVREAHGELERKIAKRLATHPAELAAIAHMLWKRSATEERDRRANQRGVEKHAKRHITLELVQELETALEDLRSKQ